NAAVTLVHTGVSDWAEYTRRADIVVAAAGVPGMVQPEHIQPGATVIGAGVRYEGKRLLPDVDESCEQVAGAITPRVGGVGPTTIPAFARRPRRLTPSAIRNFEYSRSRCCLTAASVTTSSSATSLAVAGATNASCRSAGRHRACSTSISRRVRSGAATRRSST